MKVSALKNADNFFILLKKSVGQKRWKINYDLNFEICVLSNSSEISSNELPLS